MRGSWYITLWRMGRWLVTRLLLPGVAVATPFVIAFGMLRPDANAISALRLRSHEFALLVGVGGGEKCVNGLGRFYLPLVHLDQKYWHADRYILSGSRQ